MNSILIHHQKTTAMGGKGTVITTQGTQSQKWVRIVEVPAGAKTSPGYFENANTDDLVIGATYNLEYENNEYVLSGDPGYGYCLVGPNGHTPQSITMIDNDDPNNPYLGYGGQLIDIIGAGETPNYREGQPITYPFSPMGFGLQYVNCQLVFDSNNKVIGADFVGADRSSPGLGV